MSRSDGRGVRLSKRARIAARDRRLPFVPPEDWHEPREDGGAYSVVTQNPGRGFVHVVGEQEVRSRLSELPAELLAGLEIVQLSRMTRKKQSFPCYGMQWGATIYLYPIEESLEEYYDRPPKPMQSQEATAYGGRWIELGGGAWKLAWTQSTIKDFYLNNILIHELGHLVDRRNSRSVDRERFAEWFALQYGYQASRSGRTARKRVWKRHH